MDYSTLSKEEKKDIFEMVNSTHLKLKGDQKKLETLYQWALTFPGGGIEKLHSDDAYVDKVIAAKIKKGIYLKD